MCDIHTAVGFLLIPAWCFLLARPTLLARLAVGAICQQMHVYFSFLYIAGVLPVVTWLAPSAQISILSWCKCEPMRIAVEVGFIIVRLIHPPKPFVRLARADAPEYACAVEMVEFHGIHDTLKPSVQCSVWEDCRNGLRFTSSFHRCSDCAVPSNTISASQKCSRGG